MLKITVSLNLSGKDFQVGTLWTSVAGRTLSSSFQYTQSWLASEESFSLEPSLPLKEEIFHTRPGQSLFGIFQDASPNRWGKMLLLRDNIRRDKFENKKSRTLLDFDFLLLVPDFSRMGALRFSCEEQIGIYSTEESVIPVLKIGDILNKIKLLEIFEESVLKDIVAPGSSLGGARPKASILDNNGQLYMAKFPAKNDTLNVPVWEAVAFSIAKKSGLNVPDFLLLKQFEHQIFLSKRFDRGISPTTGKAERYHYASAMTLLGYSDGEHGSYLEINDILTNNQDKKELWSRIIVNILCSNVDDHLRNHGFLFDVAKMEWRLSPVFDLEPLPEHISPLVFQTSIGLYDSGAGIDEALSVCEEFGLSLYEAKQIVKNVAEASASWAMLAKQFGIGQKELEYMETAFEHEEFQKAKKLEVGMYQGIEIEDGVEMKR